MTSTVQGRTPTAMMPTRPDGDHEEEPTPICRCRVLYLGSTSSQVLDEGLGGIQHQLGELYPEQGAKAATGIDSWISVWSNGLLLENVDEQHKKVTKFFAIESLQYCAAIRYVRITAPPDVSRGRFFPLDSEVAKKPNAVHPPLFACTLENKTRAKLPECLLFICKSENHANSLVRCCFHAYADTMHAKQLETADRAPRTTQSSTLRSQSHISMHQTGGYMSNNGTLKVTSSRAPTAMSRVPYNGYAPSRMGTPGPATGIPPAPLPPHAYSIYDPNSMGTLRSVHSVMRVPLTVATPAIATPAPKESSTWKFLTLKQRKKKNSQKEEAPQLPIRRAASVFSIPTTSSRPASVMLPAGIPQFQQPFHSNMAGPLAAAQPAYLIPVPNGKTKSKSGLKFGTFSVRSKKSKEVATVLPGPYTVLQPGLFSGPAAPAAPPLYPLGAPQPAPAALRRISSQTTLRPEYNSYDVYPMEQQQQLVIGTVQRPPPAMTMRKTRQGSGDNYEQVSVMSSSGLYEEGNMTVRGLPHSVARQQHQSRPFGTFSGYPSGDRRPHDKKERELIQMVQELVLNDHNSGTEPSQMPSNYKYTTQRNGLRF